MADYTDNELENSEMWDHSNPERHTPVARPRAIVSVAFSRRDFEIVTDCAEHLGKKTSEFIRDAALKEAQRRDIPQTMMFAGSGSLGVIMGTFVAQTATKAGVTMRQFSGERELTRTG